MHTYTLTHLHLHTHTLTLTHSHARQKEIVNYHGRTALQEMERHKPLDYARYGRMQLEQAERDAQVEHRSGVVDGGCWLSLKVNYFVVLLFFFYFERFALLDMLICYRCLA